MIKTLKYYKGASTKLPKSESASTHCNQATVKFYSEAHALNYAVNHFNEIEILAPQSIVNKISIRKKELIKKLKI